eukprot:9074405-Lingulodinium_polyedra.AAC.1
MAQMCTSTAPPRCRTRAARPRKRMAEPNARSTRAPCAGAHAPQTCLALSRILRPWHRHAWRRGENCGWMRNAARKYT